MKLEAINQISKLTEEDSVKEILTHLKELNKQNALNLSRHYNDIKIQYEDVFKNCAMILPEDVLVIH